MVSLEPFHYVFFLLFSGFLPVLFGVYLQRQEDSVRVKLFEVFLVAASLWSFAYLFQVLSVWPSSGFWLRFKYIGIVTVPLAWLFFALEYVGKKKWVSKRIIVILSLIPIFILISIWTNEIHHFFWAKMVTRSQGPFMTTYGVFGPLFWVHSAYSYALLLGGALLILWHLAKVGKIYFKQALILSIGILVPLIGNVGELAGFVSLNNFDLTPLLFPFTIASFTWALSQYGFMDLVPMSQGLVFDKIEDPILVLNDENKVLKANEAAKDIVSGYFSPPRSTELMGGEMEELFSNDPGLVDDIRLGNEARIRIETEGDGERYFDLKIDTIKDDREQLVGRVLLFRDITELEELKENKFLYTLLRQDLRSKYQTIQGYLQLLEEADFSEEQEKHLRKALRTGKEAEGLIRMAKKLGEIERTERTGEKDIVRFLGHVTDDISSLIEKNGVEIEEYYPENISKVKGDYSLNTLFTQILVTRIQVGECNKIRIDASEREEDILLRMEDNGEKLPEDIKSMFSGESYTGETTGVGGVKYYMIRRIAEHNKAEIKVKDSKLGGTRFDVHLQKP